MQRRDVGTHDYGSQRIFAQAEKIPDKWFMIAAATVAQSLDEKDMEARTMQIVQLLWKV